MKEASLVLFFIRDVLEKAYKLHKEELRDTNYRIQYVHQTLFLGNASAIVAEAFINAVIDIAPLLNRRSACLTATGRGSKSKIILNIDNSFTSGQPKQVKRSLTVVSSLMSAAQ